MSKRVIVAMSGGVDSSVTAALLHRQGFEVIGVTLRLTEMSGTDGVHGSCCGVAGLEDARQVAARIGIPFYVLNYEHLFEQTVITPFCQAYGIGQTPNPCIDCNAHIKFGKLLKTSLAIGVDFLATGHYARLEHSSGNGDRPVLLKGRDRERDQSYFLYLLQAEQLDHVLFPLGSLLKREVRKIARDIGLRVSDKPASQDICFVQGTSYQAFLGRRCRESLRPGPIVDSNGVVVGQHRGIAAYTVGQRRGLGVAAREPMYVRSIDAVHNRIVIAPKESMYCQTLRVGQVNWLAGDVPASQIRLSVKTRYGALEVPADVTAETDGGAIIRFLTPQPVVAPGQSAVFYDGEQVIGGGAIESYE